MYYYRVISNQVIFLKLSNVFVHTLLTETTYVNFDSSKLKFSSDVYLLIPKLCYVGGIGYVFAFTNK